MTSVVIIHYYLQPNKRGAFDHYAVEALRIFKRHGGEILSAFQPAGHGSRDYPDEIQVLRFPSEENFVAYQRDRELLALDPLYKEAVSRVVLYHSETFQDHIGSFETVIAKRRQPILPDDNIDTALNQNRFSEHTRSQILTVISGKQVSSYDRMQSLVRQWQNSRNRRVIFGHTYLLMTGNMLEAMEAGEFHDRTWISSYLSRFAGYYFRALEQYERGWFLAPPVWRVAFQVAENPQTMTWQHLLLGINAHINFDLVSVLIDLLDPIWERLGAEDRARRYRDHEHVNEIIGRTMEAVQDRIIARYSPLLDALNRVPFEIEDRLVAKAIRTWREQVWKHATGIIEISDKEERQQLRDKVEYIALRRADWITLKNGPFKISALH